MIRGQKVKRISISILLGLNAGNLRLNSPRRWCDHLYFTDWKLKPKESKAKNIRSVY